MGSVESSFGPESSTLEDILVPEDGDITNDSLQPGMIPDSEENQYGINLRPDDEDPMKDELLLVVINSGAFRSHTSEGALLTHQLISHIPASDDEGGYILDLCVILRSPS